MSSCRTAGRAPGVSAGPSVSRTPVNGAACRTQVHCWLSAHGSTSPSRLSARPESGAATRHHPRAASSRYRCPTAGICVPPASWSCTRAGGRSSRGSTTGCSSRRPRARPSTWRRPRSNGRTWIMSSPTCCRSGSRTSISWWRRRSRSAVPRVPGFGPPSPTRLEGCARSVRPTSGGSSVERVCPSPSGTLPSSPRPAPSSSTPCGAGSGWPPRRTARRSICRPRTGPRTSGVRTPCRRPGYGCFASPSAAFERIRTTVEARCARSWPVWSRGVAVSALERLHKA